MARSTQALSTGLKILSGQDVPIYTLEHLTPTKNHSQGSFEKIVIPYIELGRNSKCAVSFGEDFPTVSRRHAAITREGKEVKIKNLSSNNPLLLNGRPVNREFFLSSGDEIQLSLEGPRLRYNTTASGTAKMGFTNKMNLVIQQAIKPYKTLAISLFALFIVSTGGLGYGIHELFGESENLKVISHAQAQELAKINQENIGLAEKIKKDSLNVKERLDKVNAENASIKRENEIKLNALRAQMTDVIDSLSKLNPPEDFSIYIKDVQKYVLAVYWISSKLTMQGTEILNVSPPDPTCMCTGFLLNDGKFVTARHCIDIHTSKVRRDGSILIDEFDFLANSGGDLTITFKAKSFDGSIDFTFTNKDMIQDSSKDELVEVSLKGVNGSTRVGIYHNGTDYTYKQVNTQGGLNFDGPASKSLETATKLHVLGYPDGTTFRQDGDMRPDYNMGIVRRTGLTEGVIRGIQGAERVGNSGGPVFTLKNGQPVIVGIVTGARQLEGEEVFQVYTPISTVVN